MQLQTVVSDGDPLLYTGRVAHGACNQGVSGAIIFTAVVENVEMQIATGRYKQLMSKRNHQKRYSSQFIFKVLKIGCPFLDAIASLAAGQEPW